MVCKPKKAVVAWATIEALPATVVEALQVISGNWAVRKGLWDLWARSRWKQRALYDAIKDAYALYSPKVSLARVSIHDQIAA